MNYIHNVELGLLDLVKEKNTGPPVKFEFEKNNESFSFI